MLLSVRFWIHSQGCPCAPYFLAQYETYGSIRLNVTQSDTCRMDGAIRPMLLFLQCSKFCVPVQGKMTRNTVIVSRRWQNHTASTVASTALIASKKPSLGQRRRTYSYPWLQKNPGIKLQASQSAHCEHQTPLSRLTFAINLHGCGVMVTRSLHGVKDEPHVARSEARS